MEERTKFEVIINEAAEWIHREAAKIGRDEVQDRLFQMVEGRINQLTEEDLLRTLWAFPQLMFKAPADFEGDTLGDFMRETAIQYAYEETLMPILWAELDEDELRLKGEVE